MGPKQQQKAAETLLSVKPNYFYLQKNDKRGKLTNIAEMEAEKGSGSPRPK